MDLMTIAQRTGIAPRTLRYVIYHMLMPGVSRVEVGKGNLRHFTEFEAFGIATAAILLQAGVKRGLAEGCLNALGRHFAKDIPLERIPLYSAFCSKGAAHLEIADRCYVRLRVDRSSDCKATHGWKRADGSGLVPADYEPMVKISMNLAPLRDWLKS